MFVMPSVEARRYRSNRCNNKEQKAADQVWLQCCHMISQRQVCKHVAIMSLNLAKTLSRFTFIYFSFTATDHVVSFFFLEVQLNNSATLLIWTCKGGSSTSKNV